MDKVARLMKDRLTKNNYLAELAEVGKLNTKQKWKKFDKVDFDFLEMQIGSTPTFLWIIPNQTMSDIC